MSYQSEKALVLAHYEALKHATPSNVADVLRARCAPDVFWRGVHPWHEQTGPDAIAQTFWQPFLKAFTKVQRRQDIFIAGDNGLEAGGRWVASMGHLLGLFDEPFLGIPPTGRIAMLRYAEFNRVDDGVITETAFFPDIMHLMSQAGVAPFPNQAGAHLIQPGPMTHDGLRFDGDDPAESAKTIALIEQLIFDINRNSNDGSGRPPFDASPQEEMARCWHDDMLWWGPEGVGSTYSIDRYVEQHQQPFRTKLTNRTFNGHICRFAEGTYGGFFGWPNLTVTSLGGYLGLPEGTVGDMRVVDMYRRDGDKLAENWVFIDVLHYLNMQGIDVLGKLAHD